MFSVYHVDKKPWILKALSLFVIFTFLVTQSDVQLFASVIAPAASAPLPGADLAQNDKIHYVTDIEKAELQGQADQNPLSVNPDEAQAEPLAGDIPENQIPQISTTFLIDQNPLAGKTSEGAETVTDALTGIVTVSYADHTYFKYQSEGHPTEEDGTQTTRFQILEICDFTRKALDADGNPLKDADGKDVYELEVRKFEPVNTASCPNCLRIVTEGAEGALSTYQTFTLLDEGQLGSLFEAGYWVPDAQGQDSDVPSVRYEGDRVTFYDRTEDSSYYIERVYQQLPAGESRLLSYQKVQNVDGVDRAVINIEIQYDDENGKLTVIHRSQSDATVSATVNFGNMRLPI